VKTERKTEQGNEQVAAIMIPTGSDRIDRIEHIDRVDRVDRVDRRRTVTITTNRPTNRRQPTTAPVRRPSVATGRALGASSGAKVRAGDRTARPARPVSRVTYWCRRAFVAALVVGLVLVMAQAGAALGGSSLATSGRGTTSSPAASSSIRHTVVRPGDSLWTVAARLAPDSDPRPVVDALSEARDGAPLVPGETVEWGG
jgi:hypothetical protein